MSLPSPDPKNGLLQNQLLPVSASRWRRFGGAMIDSVIGLVLVLPVMFMAGWFSWPPEMQELSTGQKVLSALLGWLGLMIPSGYLLLARGQTVGKLLVKTRIVDLRGNKPGAGRLVVLRSLVPWALGQIPLVGGVITLVDVLFIYGDQRRCLHDFLAGTRVVEA